MSRLPLVIVAGVLISQLAMPSAATEACRWDRTLLLAYSCNGKYKGGRTPTSQELGNILNNHNQWLKRLRPGLELSKDPAMSKDPARANLCEADLQGVNLEHANLQNAWLVAANLANANLMNAQLQGAQLQYAVLRKANLMVAHLHGAGAFAADLTSAMLFGADLSKANFESANLAGAVLMSSDLRETSLFHADLDDANLAGAHVEGADFDLLPGCLPDALDLASAEGLRLVKFNNTPAALVSLRSELKDLGIREQESELTYAIRRSELGRTEPPARGKRVHGPIERWLNYVFFDLTCQYGMSPGQPLIIVVLLSILFSVIYIFAQITPGQHGGIWAVWDQHRIDKTEGEDAPQRLIAGFPSRSQKIPRFLNIPLLAAYFSLLSALRIGWSGLNFGIWFSRMQAREYELHASGWVRFVSGLQSLISVYLVALTILSYFGTPFEY